MGVLRRVVACLTVVSICSVSLAAAVSDRIAAKADISRTVPLKGHHRPEAIPQNDAGPVDPAMPVAYATLYLKPAPGLESFLADQRNPASPDYRRWLTPEQFGERFGLSGGDIGQLTQWLQAQGLTVHDVARGKHWITFSGTAARVGQAFHTELRRYRVNGSTHFANATEISVPAAFSGVVSGVDGLHDFVPEPMHRILPAGEDPQLTSGTTHYLAPDDLALIYDISPLYAAGIDGTGQKLAVIGRTDIDLADLRAFRTRFGLPANDPQVVLYGPDPGVSSGDLVEADLDLEWAAAVARNATVIYVNSRGVNTSAQYAVDQNLAPVMTMSYGGCEVTGADTLRSVAQQASAQGITWMVSSGDSGAATCDRSSPTPQASKGATVSYPASIPEVTAVGGTQFDDVTGNWWSVANGTTRASALGYIPEKVWNESIANNTIEGGGGGASALFVKPAWQLGPGVPNDGRRDLPDVSCASAVHDGYEIVSSGVVRHVGGTSAASPVFAGVVALLNQSIAKADPKAPAGVGNINPVLYRLAQSTTDVFHDITVGDNAVPCAQGSPQCVNGSVGYAAAPGYDLATGLGSLDVAHFVKEWNNGAASTTSVTATPASYSYGEQVVITATVTGAAGIPTGAVTFVANDIALGSAVLSPGAKASTASITVNGSLLAGGNGAAGALYGGDAIFTGSAGSTSVALKMPASGSLLIPSVNPNPVTQSGTSWPYTLRLSEKAGVATKITVFTVNNVNNLSALSDVNVAANGVVYLSLSGSGITPPLNRVFHFEGIDADGATWQRDLTVPFVGPQGTHVTPAILLRVSPDTVQQNPAADPACPWAQQVTVQERTGFQVTLTSFSAGGVAMTGKIPQIFGTNRLAPFGMLAGTVCAAGITPPQLRLYSLSGTTETGSVVSTSATATFAGPSQNPAAFSIPQTAVQLSPGTTATLDLNFSTGTPAWTLEILPAAQRWLGISAVSGAGSARLTLNASAAGLSNGVYNAWISVQAADARPQAFLVPVVFVVGNSPEVSVSGVGNAASGAHGFAPGQLIAIYGSDLAPSVVSAAVQPLPLSLAGVSATVNGISAPLWFISPGQINLQIPYEVGGSTAVLGINNNGKVAASTFPMSSAAPGIFAYQGALVPAASARAGQTIVGFITGDGDVTPTLATGATAAAGSTLAQLPQSRQPLSLTVGGEQARIVFNGIVPGLIGVTQVNFTVPADVAAGDQPVVVTAGGVSSTPVKLTVTP